MTLRTDRLVLRHWTDADLEPFAALNADSEVMEFFPAPLSREQSDALAQRIRTQLDTHGWGLWAVEHEGTFIGCTGLAPVTWNAPFTPRIEVGWRLARPAWGQGFATEAARAALAAAYADHDIDSVVSFTARVNRRSQNTMLRVGFNHNAAEDFDHPALPEGHPLRRHVLYRATLPNLLFPPAHPLGG